MDKRKFLAILCFLFIFNSFFLSQRCSYFILTKDMFNLDLIRSDKSRIIYQSWGNLNLTAFTYEQLGIYELQSFHTIIGYYIQEKEANDDKINLFGLINYVEKSMAYLGFDVFSSEETLKYTLNEIRLEVNNSKTLSKTNKDSLIAKLDGLDPNINNIKGKTHTIKDTIVTVGSITFASISVYAVSSLITLPALTSTLLFLFLTISSAGYVSYEINEPLEEEIRKAKHEIIKQRDLFEMLYYQIQEVKWEGNNIILTGVSSLDYCDKSQVKFDYDNKIKYNNYSIIVHSMIDRTCVLKKSECKNFTNCKNNLLDYVKCQFKSRKGLESRCPMFQVRDCSLESVDPIFDEL